MKKIIVALCLSILIVITAAGCSTKPLTEKDISGIYNGDSGSVLVLHDDGTIDYKEADGTDAGKGLWSYSEGKITVMPAKLGYEIDAEIDPDSTEVSELVFKS